MATSDNVTVTEGASDMISDEIGDEIVKRELTFGFDVKTAKTDLTLLVEDRKIYVTRAALEMISPVFEKIFCEQLLDGERKEVRIHGKTFEDFVEFLACIYPRMMREVTRTNVHKVLPLAFEYDVDFLKRRCESVLIDEMKAGVDESFIVQCTKVAIPYLSFVRQLGLDEIVKRRLKEIEDLDEQLPLDTEGKIYVYEKMLTSLRSEACKYRYLSAGRNCQNTVNLEPFTDAKYKKLDFELLEDDKTDSDVVIWNRSFRLDVNTKADIWASSGITLYVNDEDFARFPMASKVVVKNNDPRCPQGDFCIQEVKVIGADSTPEYFSDELKVRLPLQDLQDVKYRMNGVYKISVHILMNKPENS